MTYRTRLDYQYSNSEEGAKTSITCPGAFFATRNLQRSFLVDWINLITMQDIDRFPS